MSERLILPTVQGNCHRNCQRNWSLHCVLCNSRLTVPAKCAWSSNNHAYTTISAQLTVFTTSLLLFLRCSLSYFSLVAILLCHYFACVVSRLISLFPPHLSPLVVSIPFAISKREHVEVTMISNIEGERLALKSYFH